VEPSNAWDRAQEALDRASERDSAVITPDTAVSPFDASSTMVIPRADVLRRGTPTDPDTTQRLSYGSPPPPPSRQPADPRGPGGNAQGGNGNGRPSNGQPANGRGPGGPGRVFALTEPPTTPTEVSDPKMVRVSASTAHPGTSPFPASDPGAGWGPDARADESPAPPPKRSFWRRLFGRG